MVVNPSSPCTLSTASFNVLQSSGTRIEVVAAVVVVEVEGEAGEEDFVSPVDDACTTRKHNNHHHTKQQQETATRKGQKNKTKSAREQ